MTTKDRSKNKDNSRSLRDDKQKSDQEKSIGGDSQKNEVGGDSELLEGGDDDGYDHETEEEAAAVGDGVDDRIFVEPAP